MDPLIRAISKYVAPLCSGLQPRCAHYWSSAVLPVLPVDGVLLTLSGEIMKRMNIVFTQSVKTICFIAVVWVLVLTWRHYSVLATVPHALRIMG